MSNENPVGARILIADDNEMIREAISSVLVMKGYDVLECEDGGQTIALLSAEPIDFLILDLQMPHVTGYEVLDWLTSQRIEVNVAICTGTIVDEDALERHDVTVFQKPFRMLELLAEIESSLVQTVA